MAEPMVEWVELEAEVGSGNQWEVGPCGSGGG